MQTVLLDPQETARWLGITSGVLAKWRYSGRSPAYVKVGGRVRYRVADLEAWIASRVRHSTSDLSPENKDVGPQDQPLKLRALRAQRALDRCVRLEYDSARDFDTPND